MKKLLACFVVSIILTGGLYAQQTYDVYEVFLDEWAVFGVGYTRTYYTDGFVSPTERYSWATSRDNKIETIEPNNLYSISFGFVYKYWLWDLTTGLGQNEMQNFTYQANDNTYTGSQRYANWNELTFGLYLRYPFGWMEPFTISPFAGIEYHLFEWANIWPKAGIQLEFKDNSNDGLHISIYYRTRLFANPYSTDQWEISGAVPHCFAITVGFMTNAFAKIDEVTVYDY